jgi:hypothetical protein
MECSWHLIYQLATSFTLIIIEWANFDNFLSRELGIQEKGNIKVNKKCLQIITKFPVMLCGNVAADS